MCPDTSQPCRARKFKSILMMAYRTSIKTVIQKQNKIILNWDNYYTQLSEKSNRTLK
jgi:hypothetical protein